MKKSIIIALGSAIISLSGFTGHIFAQRVLNISDIESLFEQKLAGKKIQINTVNYIGSPFMNDEWLSGDIHLITGNWVKNKQLKYNSLTDELIWLRPSDYSMIELEKEQICEFQINEIGMQKSFHFKKMNLYKTDSVKKFYQVLYENRYGLYCERRVIHVSDAARNRDYTDYSVPILEKAPVYIIMSGSGEFITLNKLSNKTLLNSYPHNKNDLKNLLRDKHLRLKAEEDLIMFVKAAEEYNLLN